jgi:hypothetical protein
MSLIFIASDVILLQSYEVKTDKLIGKFWNRKQSDYRRTRDLYGPTPIWITLFHLFFQVLCNWLSGLEHLASCWEVSRLSTRLNFDFFFFRIFKISRIYLFFYIFLKFGKCGINLLMFKAPPVQIWSSCCTGFTYFPPPSHCDNSERLFNTRYATIAVM